MKIIEKIKAGHPVEAFFEKNNEITIILHDELNPGEVLTEEWARYYINIKQPLEWRNWNSPMGYWNAACVWTEYTGECDSEYRLPMPNPKMRNITPEELPPFWGLCLDGTITAKARWEATPDMIESWVNRNAKWVVNFTSIFDDRKSFQVPDDGK